MIQNNIQNRQPNFLSGDKFYLMRCFVCDPEGRENYSVAVASGQCAWCGWNYFNYDEYKFRTGISSTIDESEIKDSVQRFV